MPRPAVMESLTKEVFAASEGLLTRYFAYSRARRSAEWEALARGPGYQKYSG
jgi:hypothetical protein